MFERRISKKLLGEKLTFGLVTPNRIMEFCALEFCCLFKSVQVDFNAQKSSQLTPTPNVLFVVCQSSNHFHNIELA